MKKLASVLLILVLCLSCALASAETYTADGYFSLTYPDTFELDDETYVDESTDASRWLFMLIGDEYTIDANLETLEEYAGFSLFNATDAEKQTYCDETLESFADYECTYVGSFETTQNAIPFYVYTMVDTDGPYYFIETIANGTSICFYCNYTDGSEPDEALLEQITPILQTLTPAA